MRISTLPTAPGEKVVRRILDLDTTLHFALKRVTTEELNGSTVDDPVEMTAPFFNQTQVQTQLDFAFPEGLRARMRRYPDIIMVVEIRDQTSAGMAVRAAFTGHVVFSTLHTKDAPSAVTCLMALGVPSYLINVTLLGVLAQRLARTLCRCPIRTPHARCWPRWSSPGKPGGRATLQARGPYGLPHDGVHGAHGPA